jgi:hypothetical protein
MKYLRPEFIIAIFSSFGAYQIFFGSIPWKGQGNQPNIITICCVLAVFTASLTISIQTVFFFIRKKKLKKAGKVVAHIEKK